MNYRPEIDGLRALSVTAVILFHAGFGFFSGGFVGVDVFFVISGFLITTIIASELQSGDFSLMKFYERRACRILPALFIVMLFCVPFAYIWMFPIQLRDFAQSLAATSLFASNFLFWKESGYFQEAAELKPLLHTWSLAVEEQYYVFFPVFLAVFWRTGTTLTFGIIVALAAASLLLAELSSRNWPNANFFLAPTRVWELFAGSICAFLILGQGRMSSNFLSGTGLALILGSVLVFDESTPFPSFFTLGPVLGAALIILFASPETLVAKLLSTRPLVALGLVSYSAYLWHQPLFAFARLRSLTEPSHLLMFALSLGSIVLAVVTWRFVEQPFRKKNPPLIKTRRRVFAMSTATALFFAGLGLVGHFGNGFGWRSNGEVTFAELEARITHNGGLMENCSKINDLARSCYNSLTPEFLLWGDSYAMHLSQGLLESETDVELRAVFAAGCSPILGVAKITRETPINVATECIEANNDVIRWLQSQRDVEIVILSSPFSGFTKANEVVVLDESGSRVSRMTQAEVASNFLKTIRSIRKTGARVVIVSPTPSNGANLGYCTLKAIFFQEDVSTCDFATSQTLPARYSFLEELGESTPIYWLYKDICHNAMCRTMKQGTLIYRDAGHLTKEGSTLLGRSNDWVPRFRELAN